MFKDRKIQQIGMAVLLVAVALLVISAVRLPFPEQEGTGKFVRVFAESNQSGMAQYHLSERGSIADGQAGIEIYLQSERVEAYPAKASAAGLELYHQSEWHSK